MAKLLQTLCLSLRQLSPCCLLAASTCYSPTHVENPSSQCPSAQFFSITAKRHLWLDLTSKQARDLPVFWWQLPQPWQPLSVQKLTFFGKESEKPSSILHAQPIQCRTPPSSTSDTSELPKEASGKCICVHPVWHKIMKGEKRCSLNFIPEFSIITVSLCQNWKQCKLSQEGPSIMHCRAVCRYFMKYILFKPVYTTLTLLKGTEGGPVFSP